MALHGVLTHIVLQEFLHLVVLVKRHLLETHVGTDEMYKFVRGDFTKTFESRYLRVRTEVLDGALALFVGIAIARDEIILLLTFSKTRVGIGNNLLALDLRAAVADTEKRSLKDIDMPLLDELWIELEEERYDEQTDVHSVDIGIGSHDDLVVAQVVETILNVEGSLKKVELLILIHHLFAQTIAIQRLASQREHRLSVHVAALGDASAGRVALGDEDARLFLTRVLGVAEMDAAVA